MIASVADDWARDVQWVAVIAAVFEGAHMLSATAGRWAVRVVWHAILFLGLVGAKRWHGALALSPLAHNGASNILWIAALAARPISARMLLFVTRHGATFVLRHAVLACRRRADRQRRALSNASITWRQEQSTCAWAGCLAQTREQKATTTVSALCCLRRGTRTLVSSLSHVTGHTRLRG